jgi:predicted DNA-binding transcriptional regulator
MPRLPNKNPEMIYQAIVDCPGMRRIEISRGLNITMRMINYYLARMQGNGFLIWEDCDGDIGHKRGLWPCGKGEYKEPYKN